MAIAFETSATASGNIASVGGVTTLTCNKPASTASGDVLVAFWALRAGFADGDLALPSGWTLLKFQNQSAASPSCKMAYKAAGGSEPASYDFVATTGSATNQSVAILRFSGVDTTTPSDATASGNNGSGTTLTATGITTGTNGAMLVAGFASAQAASTITDPADMDERTAITTSCRNTVSTAAQASAGASGDKTGSQSSSTGWVAILGALKPASAGGSTYDEALTISAVGAVTAAAGATFNPTLTLAATSAYSESETNSLAAAADLAGVASTAQSSQLAFEVPLELAAVAAATSASDIVLGDTLTLSAVAALSDSVDVTFNTAVPLGATATLTDFSNATLHSDTTLSAVARDTVSDTTDATTTSTMAMRNAPSQH